MPWNESGQQGNQNPWGNKRDNKNPPDLDKLFSDLAKKIRSFLGGKPNLSQWSPSTNGQDLKYIVAIVLGVIIAVWLLAGLFIVNPAEEAVILRFGKYADVVQPGLHWYARFIDTKYLVDVQKIYSFSLQGDFLTKSSEQSDLPAQYVPIESKKSVLSDQSKNLVNVEVNVQYRISDAKSYLFNVTNPDQTIEEVAAGALSDVIGTMKLDEVLTTGRESLSFGVSQRVKEIISQYNIGLELVAVTLRKIQAPDQVRAAFSDVNRAEQDKSTFIQQAQAYASKIVPLAQGVAARTLADATAYQQKVVLTAKANVARYEALLKAYLSSPEVTRERMYLDTMQNVLQNTTKIVVDVNAANNLLYLPLDKIMQRAQKTLRENKLSQEKAALQLNTNEVAMNDVENKHDAN